jgi:hypothetical protein
MANINDAFPSKYLKASDFEGDTPIVTIASIAFEEVGKEKDVRPILYYEGEQKGIVLNKTNATNITKIYGSETNDWIGKKVQIGTAWVDFQGQSVEAIRIYPPKQQRSSPNAPLKPSNGRQQFDDRNPPPHNKPYSGPAELDDEIPF